MGTLKVIFSACIIALTSASVIKDVSDETKEINSDPSLAPEICARLDSDGVLVAHEHCTRFYKCFNGEPVALVCPSGLLYNPATKECDWSTEVECGDRIIPEEPEDDKDDEDKETDTGNGNDDPSLAPKICAEDDSNGILIAHEYCNKFYNCFDGFPVPLKCPRNYYFNPKNGWCDFPDNVNCGDRIIPEDDGSDEDGDDSSNGENETVTLGPGHSDPSQAAEICDERESDGVLVAHEHCTRFYKCFDGHPVALRCPGDLLYNYNNQQCDWPRNVECGDRIIPEEEEEEKVTENPNLGHDDPSLAPEICAKEGSNGVLIAHENCNKFYNCFDGLPVPLSCPSHLLFNPSNGWCDFPRNVVCGDRYIPDEKDDDNVNDKEEVETVTLGPGPSDPSLAPEICAADESDGILIAHEHCTRFYKCFNRQPVPKVCPSNLLYNHKIQQCDWPRNVECGSRIIPVEEEADNENDNVDADNGNESEEVTVAGHCDPSEAPQLCAAANSDSVLVAHEHCNQFYVCWNRQPSVLTCPPGLHYNPTTEQCDWPRNVVCGTRIIPDE